MKAEGEFTGQKGRHREVWWVQGSTLSQRWWPRRLRDNPLECVGKRAGERPYQKSGANQSERAYRD